MSQYWCGSLDVVWYTALQQSQHVDNLPSMLLADMLYRHFINLPWPLGCRSIFFYKSHCHIRIAGKSTYSDPPWTCFTDTKSIAPTSSEPCILAALKLATVNGLWLRSKTRGVLFNSSYKLRYMGVAIQYATFVHTTYYNFALYAINFNFFTSPAIVSPVLYMVTCFNTPRFQPAQ